MYEILKTICDLLKTEGIDCCFVGELVLNYYNVPRVIYVSVWSLDVASCTTPRTYVGWEVTLARDWLRRGHGMTPDMLVLQCEGIQSFRPYSQGWD